jgi:AAA+ superfamily predicted ATPase
MSDPRVLAALRRSLDGDPRNGPLWMHYAELCEAAGDLGEAEAALRTASELAETRAEAARRLVPVLRRAGKLAEALLRCERLLEEGEDAELRAELARIEVARGGPGAQAEPPSGTPLEPRAEAAPEKEREGPARARVEGEPADADTWAAQFDWGDLSLSLADVAGLEDVKRQIRLRVIAPFQNPEIYAAFGREGGGGLLLYGPPGCGKTYVARATAGELDATFLSVDIHEVLDQYWGQSEKRIHALFEHARDKSPTVLFFDEFDALGSSRGKTDSSFYRGLVDQLLQEMDGLRGKNRDVLLFAATNMPWGVDSAFRRPGRFDRVLLVAPPDAPAREAILKRHLSRLPGHQSVDVQALVRRTELFTGADLVHLCERAAETALDRSLETGAVQRVEPAHFERALEEVQSSAIEWLSTARNYARYSNEGGQYDELTRYLKRIKRW